MHPEDLQPDLHTAGVTGPAAERLLDRTDQIVRRFVARVRERIPAAAEQPTPILINTLPAFLEHLAQALSPTHPRPLATTGTTLASEHGSERVRLTGYRPDDIVREYQVLRDVLYEVLGDAL